MAARSRNWGNRRLAQPGLRECGLDGNFPGFDMCGIFGIFEHKGRSIPDRRLLDLSAAKLRHRGPDDTGIHTGAGIGLVHTRLCLLDPSPRSAQPMWDAGRRFCMVYNGEVYNYRELRGRLEKAGIAFRTTSDTEVVLAAVIHWGAVEAAKSFEGMFTFAVYDSLERSLVLARDALGIKPLFVSEHGDRFYFTSDPRALQPWLKLTPDLLTISAYLQGAADPTRGCTFFDELKAVPSGTTVCVRRGEPMRKEAFRAVVDYFDGGEAQRLADARPHRLVDQLDELLTNSVESQLVADSPVGALCSGGVDSSLVVAMAARTQPDLAIFHANVVGRLSEYEAAAELAKRLRLKLIKVDVHDQHFVDLIPDVIEHYGYPFCSHPESVPYLMLSQTVQQHGIKAVLCGEGADECYLGYRRDVPNPRAILRELPRHLWAGARCRLRNLYGRATGRNARAKDSADEHLIVRGLHRRFEDELEHAEIYRAVGGPSSWLEPHHQWRSLHDLTHILRTLLHRNDTLGMAAGVETRFPFLDGRLLRFAVNLPCRWKVRFSLRVLEWKHLFIRDKWILRRVADRYLPASLSQRGKKPFPTDAHHRMHVSPGFYESSFVAELFRLSSREIDYLITHAPRRLKLRLMHLDVWGSLLVHELPKEQIRRRLREHVSLPA